MFEVSPKASELKTRLETFMDAHIYPNEDRFFREAEEGGAWAVQPIIQELKPKAKAEGYGTCSCPRRSMAPD